MVNVSKFLLAAAHLAFAANAFAEDVAAGSAGPRQLRLRTQRPASLLAHAATVRRKAAPPPPLLAGTVAGDAAQLAFAVAEKSDPQEVERLEEMVTQLLKDGKKNENKNGKKTPMGPSVQYIKGLIDNTMLPNREQAHQNDQDAIDAAARGVGSCQENMRDYLDQAANHKDAYKTASTDHHDCRLAESGEFMEKDNRCRPEMHEVKRLQAEATCAKVEDAQRFKYCNYQRITDAQNECDAAKRRITAAEELCDETRSRFEAKKAECDHWQGIMDNAACEHAVSKKEACSQGETCYKNKHTTFQTTFKRVQKDEVTRGGEWRALKRMQCLMGTFENGKVTDAEIEVCKRKTHVPPSINYPSAPSMDSCTMPDEYPGTAAYKEAAFGNLPFQAKGNPDAGTCYGMHL